MKHAWHLLLLLLLTGCGTEQQQISIPTEPEWAPLERITSAHLRGMHCISDSMAWASGTQGTVLLCIDGLHWSEVSIPMAKNQDLRDIHGFDRNNAVAISAGNGVSIYRTGDGGKSWRIAYEDTHRVVFFDGLDFNASGFGVAYGDPMDGKMALLMSQDFGATWKAVEDSLRPELDSNEAGYAASGTGIIVTDSTVIIATGGGPKSRMFVFDHVWNLLEEHLIPIESGAGSGIFSICSQNGKSFIAVGGSYIDSANTTSNCAVAIDGEAWLPITVQNPGGYRSCVSITANGEHAVAVGRSGSDLTRDGGLTWKSIGKEGYFTCDLFGMNGWAAGRNGKMARLVWK